MHKCNFKYNNYYEYTIDEGSVAGYAFTSITGDPACPAPSDSPPPSNRCATCSKVATSGSPIVAGRTRRSQSRIDHGSMTVGSRPDRARRRWAQPPRRIACQP